MRINPTGAIMNNFFPTCLIAINKGQLRGFETLNPVTAPILKLLMRVHSKIEKLGVPVQTALTDFVRLPTASRALENSKEPCIYFDSLEDNTVRMMLDKFPNLTTLRIGRYEEDVP